jgi:hypothetical protein
MIRCALASPWLPLTYWTAIVFAALCASRQYPMKRHSQLPPIKKVSEAVTVNADPDLPAGQSLPAGTSIARNPKPAHVWSPAVLCLTRLRAAAQHFATEAEPKTEPTVVEAQPIAAPAPVTMLSIRAESPEEPAANALSIQCRTSFAISNSHGGAVSIHGVVAQEVVSPAGKILIMAGSHVVGSGVLDQESGRLRSNGIWTIVFDDTEMKVRALLLDRPGGLRGVIGQVKPAECRVSKASTDSGGARLVVVAGNTSFTLELHGEIQLRDLASNESVN